jgi:hypothetical protein
MTNSSRGCKYVILLHIVVDIAQIIVSRMQQSPL